VFDTLPAAGDLLGSPVAEELAVIADRMQRRWVAFAVNGDPGWPEYLASEPVLLRIDADERPVTEPPDPRVVAPG
jgi:para-nitrobenzyl esterase